MASRRRLAWLVILAVTGGRLTACGGSREGADLYSRSCAKCHGAAGVPSEAAVRLGTPNLADAAWQQEATDDAIRRKITNGGGRGSLMPPFDALSAADLDGLVAYIRSLGPRQ